MNSEIQFRPIMNINNHYVIPPRITRKLEDFQVTICVAVVGPSGIAHPLHSNDNIMKRNSNHALGRWNNQPFATVMTKLFSRTSNAIHANHHHTNNQSNIIQYTFHTLSLTITSSYLVLKL